MSIYLSFQLSMSIFLQKTFWSDYLQLFAKYHVILSLNFHFFIFPPSITPLMTVHVVDCFLQIYFVPCKLVEQSKYSYCSEISVFRRHGVLILHYKACSGCVLYASTIIVARGNQKSQNYNSIIAPRLGTNHIVGQARHIYIKQLHSSLKKKNPETEERKDTQKESEQRPEDLYKHGPFMEY